LLSAGPRPKRSFFGTGEITVALGGKKKADSRGPGWVITQEDMKAYDHLRELVTSFGLGIVRIQPVLGGVLTREAM
jgi:hypothetical protein